MQDDLTDLDQGHLKDFDIQDVVVKKFHRGLYYILSLILTLRSRSPRLTMRAQNIIKETIQFRQLISRIHSFHCKDAVSCLLLQKWVQQTS